MYLLLYVDNIIFTGDNNDLVSRFFTLLAHRFSLKDLGPLAYFLGVEAVSHAHGVLLCQRYYLFDVLDHINMQATKLVLTLLSTNRSITLHSGSAFSAPTDYWVVVGSLQYLLLTRPDTIYASADH